LSKKALSSSLIILCFVLFFAACGYKPTVEYAKQSLDGKVYVSVNIDIHNIKNSILIKDALLEMVTNKFDLQITTNKALASSFIHGYLASVSETQIESDVQGYSKVYRENVRVTVTYNKKGGKKVTLTESSYSDFTVDDDSVVSQSKKDEAIKTAITKALSNIFSKIAVRSSK
jgi:hypothetical protein